MKRPLRLPSVLVLGLGLAGCVPASKYDALLVSSQSDAAELKKLHAALDAAQAATQERDAKLAELTTASHNVQASLDESTAMNEQLRGELARLGKDVDSILKERGTLTKALDDAKVRLEELRRAQAAAEARATLFRAVIDQFRSFVDAGKMRVETRHGRLSLLVNGDLLFDPQHSDLKASGAVFLTDLARALVAAAPPTSGRRFLVTAHVDDAAKGKRIGASFELGASRAIAVIDKLGSLGVRPEQLIAASAGPFDPIVRDKDADAALGKHAIELSFQPSVEDAAVVPEAK